MKRTRPTVLIIDDDLKFAFWLARLLDGAGYQAWPASNAIDATALLKEMPAQPDLLVINPDLSGVVELIEDLRQHRPFKVMAIQPQDEEPPALAVDASLMKPEPCDELSELEWLIAIERVLAKRRHSGG